MRKYKVYFGKINSFKVPIYAVCCASIAFGLLQFVLGNPVGGGFFASIGAFPMLFMSGQMTDKKMDELVKSRRDGYLEQNLRGRTIGRKELDPADFYVFSGFIRDSADVRFKACRDGKVRTSRYYVTAISVGESECVVSYCIYDLLSDAKPSEKLVFTAGASEIGFESRRGEFPKDNYECLLHITRDGKSEDAAFFLPANDSLVEELISSVSKLSADNKETGSFMNG